MATTVRQRVQDLIDDYTGRKEVIERMELDYWAPSTVAKVQTKRGMVCLVWVNGDPYSGRAAGEIEEGTSW